MKVEEKLKNLSVQQTIIATLALAAGYYFMVFDDGSNIEKVIKKQQRTLAEKTENLNNTRAAMANAKQFEEEVRRTNARFREMLEFIPVDFSIADFMQLLSTEAESSGNKVIKIQPRPSENASTLYEELLVELEIEGTFSQILQFLSKMTRVRKIINLGGIQLSTVEADPISPILRFETTMVGYRYAISSNNQGSEDEGGIQ